MRFVLLIVVLAVGFGGYWWISRQDPEAEKARLIAVAKAASAKIGMQKMLRESDVFEFTNVVISRSQTEGALEFRAMVIQQGAPRPVYGEAAPNCEDALEAAECWDIILLEVDGRPYQLGGPVPEEDGAETDQAGTTQEDPETDANTEDTATVDPEEPTPAQPEDAASETPDATQDTRPGPTATHEVARPLINARSGPGTSNEVLTRLSGGSRLAQISASEGWGQFLVLSGDSEGMTVWIAFSILSPVGS